MTDNEERYDEDGCGWEEKERKMDGLCNLWTGGRRDCRGRRHIIGLGGGKLSDRCIDPT